MRSRVLATTRLLVFGSLAIPWMYAADAGNSDLERKFTQTVRPFVTSYCTGCHSGTAPAAQFDLKSYSTLSAVVHDYPHWNLVMEKLKAKEMPPKAVKQPSEEARQEVIDW